MIGSVLCRQKVFFLMAESCERKHLKLLDTLSVMTSSVQMGDLIAGKTLQHKADESKWCIG